MGSFIGPDRRRDGIFRGGIGSDIFGEEATGRLDKRDDVNAYLRTKYLGEYLQWQHKNHHFHPDFE